MKSHKNYYSKNYEFYMQNLKILPRSFEGHICATASECSGAAAAENICVYLNISLHEVLKNARCCMKH